MEVEFNIFTDFNQFIVFDSRADWGDLYEKWTDETIRAMFVQGDGYIAVGTMRRFEAPVVVRLADSIQPAENADKTQQGMLSIPSGVLEVAGITDGGASGGTLNVPPGDYRVNIDYLNLDSMDAEQISGEDRYVVTLAKVEQ